MGSNTSITYADAGVDIEAGDKAVELMKESVKATLTSQVLTGAGGFAGMFDISAAKGMESPILATSTDGVGTKVDIARALDKHDTIGYDLVGMVVDDIAVTGAKPLFMTDYICCGHVEPTRIANLVGGVARACQVAGTALVGGETAEHPGLLAADEYDIAGAAVGIIDKKDLLGPDKVQAGDKVVALASSGLHSNGYSLVRAVFKSAGWDYSRPVPEFAGEADGLGGTFGAGVTLGEVLLAPTRIYSALCLELAAATDVHTFSHVTGGGLASNLARVLPQGLSAYVERSSWDIPQIFNLVQELGGVPQADLEQTLNIGVGMVAVVGAEDADKVIALSQAAGVEAWVAGEVLTDAQFNTQFPTLADSAARGTKGVNGGAAVLV
jgi:phosphoribosylformylglycinamidine cyclo-ligase